MMPTARIVEGREEELMAVVSCVPRMRRSQVVLTATQVRDLLRHTTDPPVFRRPMDSFGAAEDTVWEYNLLTILRAWAAKRA